MYKVGLQLKVTLESLQHLFNWVCVVIVDNKLVYSKQYSYCQFVPHDYPNAPWLD